RGGAFPGDLGPRALAPRSPYTPRPLPAFRRASTAGSPTDAHRLSLPPHPVRVRLVRGRFRRALEHAPGAPGEGVVDPGDAVRDEPRALHHGGAPGADRR